MAKITQFKGYDSPTPTIPKPDTPVDPMILTVQDGVPVAYPRGDTTSGAIFFVSHLGGGIAAAALFYIRFRLPFALLLIAGGSLIGVFISYGRVLGRDSGIALLVVMLALKLMEMAALRDAMVLIFIAYFLVITNFLYSQTIPTTVFMLVMMWMITATMIGFQFRTRQPDALSSSARSLRTP